MTLLTSLRTLVEQHGRDKTYWVAYSGGLDSCVLLALCYTLSLEQTLSLQVIHVHHGLSPNAEAWSQHCAAVCHQYHLPLKQISIQLHQDGDSVEALAREKRYDVFAQHMQAGDVLLTAHHEDDQAETFLLQLLRGAGVKGLSAMPHIKSFANGWHARPLLTYSRATLKEYAIKHALSWVEDESNDNTAYARNYLRHEIMPSLQSYWPTANKLILRSASHCAEAQYLLTEFGELLCEQAKGSATETLSVRKLKLMTTAQQRLALRTWIQLAKLSIPNEKKLNAILTDVLTAAQDRFPCVSWGDVEVRRYRDDLHVMKKLSSHDVSLCVRWDVTQPIDIPGVGLLQLTELVGNTAVAEAVDSVEIRFRQGGEVIEWPGRGSQTLKKLCQEWSVLPWLRDRLPLVYVENKLVGVINAVLNGKFIILRDTVI